ncbi:hypothetical protein [Nonomuraea aridisoli]|nr:hypothetical protein [Nonomuraea aridisoli]
MSMPAAAPRLRARMPRLPVPHVTAYEGEAMPYDLAAVREPGTTEGVRLAFTDPIEQDWMWGVLWHRQGLGRGGDPIFDMVNTPRQRRCMRLGLCQVCGRTARDPESHRLWWVMAHPAWLTEAGEPYVSSPPTCRSCIRVARRLCPKLPHDAPAYTAAAVQPYGVLGNLYHVAGLGRVALKQEKVILPFDDFRRLEFTLATQLLAVLEDLRPEDLPPGDHDAELLAGVAAH